MRLVLSLLFVCIVFAELNAQVPAPFSRQQLVSYPKDFWGILKSPVYWTKREWSRTFVAGAVIFGASTLDNDVANWVAARPNNSFSNGNLAGSRHWGDGLYNLPVFAGLYFWGKHQANDQHQLAAMNATKAFVLSRILVQIPKYLFQRHAPYQQSVLNPFLFDGPFGSGKQRSFPSGHVISVFSAAEVFRLSYEDWWVGALSYAVAGSVAMHRMGSGSHWFSDVTTSAIWGAAIGHWIAKKGQTNLSLLSTSLPHSSGQTYGLLWRF